MPAGLQAKLLRVLERHVITRVGGTAEIPIDVRVVTATNRDLEKEITRGHFREDLFFRVSAFTLIVPPLRDRPIEIPLLANHFARGFASELGVPVPTLSASTMAVLTRHTWPGNVRELKNAIERAVVLQTDGAVEIDHLPERVRAAVARPGGGATGAQALLPASESTSRYVSRRMGNVP